MSWLGPIGKLRSPARETERQERVGPADGRLPVSWLISHLVAVVQSSVVVRVTPAVTGCTAYSAATVILATQDGLGRPQ